jgi:glycosyltransferase involved in cell wall biosynthesis
MLPVLSIVVPCYNEAQNIPLIFEAFNTLLKTNDAVEIILVNNGSTDVSQQIFEQQLQQYKTDNFKLVQIPINKGYGHGILEGLKNAAAPVLSWTHADLQTNPMDVLKALSLYSATLNPYLVIKGRRRKRNSIDAFFTWGMELYTQYKLRTGLSDINAQPKLFSRVFYETIYKDAPADFSLDLYWLYKAKKIGTIKTIDVFFAKRLYGEAKGGGTLKGKWRLIKRTVQYINQLAITVKQ